MSYLTVEEYKLRYALTDEVTPADATEALVYALIAEAANDVNSAKYREDITKLIVGLRPSEGKLGYDDDYAAIEVKPVNYTGKTKLDGHGHFSDFTWKRHRKYQADNVRMLISGFNRGKLLYVVEFPYSTIAARIESILLAKLPHGDVKGSYVRTAAFGWRHWSEGTYTVAYLAPTIASHRGCFNGKFYQLLIATRAGAE